MSDQKELYDVYVQQRDMMERIAFEAGGRYDKSILFIAGGALILSMTFVTDFAKDIDWPKSVLLAFGWFLLILCILANLYVQAISQVILQIRIKDWHETMQLLMAGQDASPKDEKLTQKHRKWFKFFSNFSLYSFVVGMLLLVIFSMVCLIFPNKPDLLPL